MGLSLAGLLLKSLKEVTIGKRHCVTSINIHICVCIHVKVPLCTPLHSRDPKPCTPNLKP